MIGRTLGHYEVLAKLGAGGMGEVYKAKDTHLDRFVALKVLRPDAVADAERTRRFVQEAKAASALNHPNIVTIHDIARADGVDYIVMEYVAGKTLDQLIGRGGMTLRDLLDYAGQAADALANAHAAGIVHRDLKPSNIMVTGDGRVKILDFGLAKLASTESADEAETTLGHNPVHTGAGWVVGTPAFMSPEQAEGKAVDARSDVFSFGAVLYEMATGHSAFRRESAASTLAAVLTAMPPPPSQTAPHLPRELERVIVRCLRKEPSRRFQFMADLVVELEDIKTESGERIEAAAGVRTSRRRWPWMAATGAATAVVAAGAWTLWPRATTPGAPTIVSLTTYQGEERAPSLSPDGTQVAFVWTGERQGNLDIYVKPVDAATYLRLTTDPLRDISPNWSPSGRQIAFVRLQADGRAAVYVTPPIPGSEQKIAVLRRLGGGAPQFDPAPTWTPDGRWLVVADLGTGDGDNGLFLISVESGERRPIVNLPLATVRYGRAVVSPAGKSIAYVGCRLGGTAGCDVWVQPLTDLSPEGAPRQLTQFRGAVNGVAWAPDGLSLVVGATTSQGAFAHLWRVPISGSEPTRLDWLGSSVSSPAVSQTGRRLVAVRSLDSSDIWRFDASSSGTLPTDHPVSSSLVDADPEFSPDGSRIAFTSARSGQDSEIWVARSDGSGAMQLTRGAAGRNRGSPRWSSDGNRIVFDSASEDGVRRAYVIDATGGGAQPISDYHTNYPSWSHDDRWIYFGSNRSGRLEVWRVSATGGTPEQVTRDGGTAPRASADTLYYRRGATVYARPLSGGPEQLIVGGLAAVGAYLPLGHEIFYVAQTEPSPSPSAWTVLELRAMDLATKKMRSISRFDATLVLGLTVSPDRKTALLGVLKAASDLMLVENFK